jgi:FkbM family methyltransferase
MSYFERAGFEPRPNPLTDAVKRLSGFLTSRVPPFMKLPQLPFLGNASANDPNNIDGDDCGFDILPPSDIGSICRILRAAGVFRENAIVLELGAGSGVQTLEIATCGAFALVVAVEPEGDNFSALQRNVDESELTDVVCCLPCAVGIIDGMTNFYVNREDRLRSSIKQRTDLMIRTPMSTVSTILQDTGIAPDEVALIWIDIEGYEAITCLAMTEIMAQGVPIHAVLSPEWYHADQGSSLIRYLATYYHRCVVMDDPSRQVTSVSKIPLDRGNISVLLID